MKIRVLSILILFIFFQACSEDRESGLVFFGGEIINPVKKEITLYKGSELVDTISIRPNNTFSYSFEASEEGLYTFWHGNESQTVYIEPGDSILFRLNTLAFDKTLVYSGKEAARNNFFMELYLMNEENNDLVFSYYKIGPSEFAQKTDSIRLEREKMLKDLEEKHQFSKKFTALAEKSIDYEFYDLRERYAFLINKYFNPTGKDIPEDFFAYREEVNFNDEQLKNLYVYQRFLDNYLKNRSIENCPPRDEDRDCYNLNDYNNLRRRILLADSLFELEVLRNRFFQRFGSKQIIFSKSQAQIDSTLALFSKVKYEDLEELKGLMEIQLSYFVGNNISKKRILTPQMEEKELGDILKKPSIIFIWSIYSPKDHKADHEKVRALRNKYPEIDFIGANLDESEPEIWLTTMKENNYDTNFEYQIRNRGRKKILYRNYLNKVFFVNEKGEIIMGNIDFDSPFLESRIVEFLNR